MRILLTVLLFAASSFPASAQSTQPPVVKGGGVTVNIDKDRPTPPDGDPRSADQRREDHASFSKCLLRMQDRTSDAFSRPGLPPDPMLYCQQKLGMDNADAVPKSKVKAP
jgi:hypothetical protein